MVDNVLSQGRDTGSEVVSTKEVECNITPSGDN